MIIESKEYEIHDNGGRPFIVKVYPDSRVEVYENNFKSDSEDDEDHYLMAEEPFFNQKVEKVFIGESPLNNMTEFSGGHGDNFLGNSFLLHTGDLEYVFIGESVFYFQALSEIVKYVSPVGNSDVSYPYAVDDQNRAYLMIEKVIVQLTDEEVSNIPMFDPYSDCYYSRHLMTTDHGCIPPREPIFIFQDIKEYYVGDERYTMTYEPYPEKDYDRLMGWNEGNISILLIDGTKKELSKEEYVDIMLDFGDLLEFQPLEREVIHKRMA
uniref:Uncharacterized protein n=1 Tax=Marseillevirus LCMAC101 TaxID=2506602 RepID=A0A481YRQ2_9VIRU|nr:MAG: hypothetical protein LCMAC101_04630 [Marseillevirus LCMAC101]